MNKFLHNIISSLPVTIMLLMTDASLTTSVSANELQRTVDSSINPREPNFFSQGREQLEREIQLLLRRSRHSSDKPLKISPKQQIQEQLSPLENPSKLQELPNPNQSIDQ
ncbi:MAG: hypothetical protein KME21_14065 [Desmonostoc vinosum HA7617-LM4]|jgi:hypothetical protein|nr:hypothetical protein [Desmonostoc vinosum HA7617-LM4]